MGKKTNRKSKTGFARTKEVPHGRHPAYYRRTGQDEVEYIPITHTKGSVELESGERVKTYQLHFNINPEERGKFDENGEELTSNALYKVYRGKRSALGKEEPGHRLEKIDEPTISFIYKTAPVEKVKYTSNSKKGAKKKSTKKSKK